MKKIIPWILIILIISTAVSAEVRVLDGEKNFISKDVKKNTALETVGVKKSNIALKKVLIDEGYEYSFYGQKYKNLEVYGAQISIIEKNKKLVSIKSNYKEFDIDTHPLLSSQEAGEIVGDDIGLVTELEPKLIIYKNQFKGADYLLAYIIETPLLEGPERWRYIIDAKTGEVILKEPLLIKIYGYVSAQVFPETPAQAQITVNLTNNNITLWQNNSLVASTLTNTGFYNFSGYDNNITLKSYLEGPYVKVLNADQTRAYFEYNGTGNESYNWNWNNYDDISDRNEESNMFYHVNIVHDYFTRGDPFNITQMNYQMNATVQYGGVECNAFYDTVSKNIYFYGGGSGCDNPALSADVIYHEYTHAVTAEIYNVFPYYKITGAMNEGYSDYYAATITNNPTIGENSWNPYIRNINNTRSYIDNYEECPTGQTASSSNDYCYVHSNSDIFGGALWDFRQMVGNTTADALIMRTIKAQPHSFSEFMEDMLILDDDNANLSDGTPNSTYICQAFTNHDIYSYYCNETRHSFDIFETALSWYDAAANGNIISSAESVNGVEGLGDDDITKPISMNFEFPFHGSKYSEIYIGSNGLVSLQNYSVDSFRYDCFIPDSNLPNTVIAPLCTDLDPGSGGDVYYWSQNDKFIVEWKNVVPYGQSEQQNIELILFQNGSILMQFQNISGITTETKIGIEDSLGIAADFLNYSDLNSLDPSAFIFIPTNTAPNITATTPEENTSISEPENKTFYINYTDFESDTITIKWYIDSVLKTENVSNMTFIGNYSSSGLLNITVNVSDYISTSSFSWTLNVNNTDTTPSINSYSPNSSNVSMTENETQYFNHSSNDVDGDTLNYSWYLNNSLEANTSYWNFTANHTSAGNWIIMLIVNDPQGNNDTNYWNLEILNQNQAPIWNSVENLSILSNETINYYLNVSDPDGNNITFWVNDSDVNVSTGNLTYEPGNFTGNKSISIAAMDNTTNTTVAIMITVTAINYSPAFNGTIPGQSWNENTEKTNAFDLDDYFSDADSNLTFNYRGVSNIVVTISTENIISFSQPAGWYGAETIVFNATDGINYAESNSITLTVNEVISTGGSSRSSGGSGIVPVSKNTISKSWVVVNAGDSKIMVINKEDIPLNSISFKVASELSSPKIVVKKLDSPPNISAKPGNTYRYIQITPTNMDVASVNIIFYVNKEWIRNNSILNEDIALFRYTDEWVELPTVILDQNRTDVIYNATTLGFSYFAIAEKEKEIITSPLENLVGAVVEPPAPKTTESANTTLQEKEENRLEEKSGLSNLGIWIGIIIILFTTAFLIFLKHHKIKLLKKYVVHKPHNHHEKLHKYVKHRLIDLNHREEAVRQDLLSVGWKKELVEIAINKFKKN